MRFILVDLIYARIFSKIFWAFWGLWEDSNDAFLLVKKFQPLFISASNKLNYCGSHYVFLHKPSLLQLSFSFQKAQLSLFPLQKQKLSHSTLSSIRHILPFLRKSLLSIFPSIYLIPAAPLLGQYLFFFPMGRAYSVTICWQNQKWVESGTIPTT